MLNSLANQINQLNSLFLCALDSGLLTPTPSSNSNTGVIIGAVVAALVVIVTVILISVCILYRRKPGKDDMGDIGNIQNAAYEGDTQTDRKLPEIPYSDSNYEEPAHYAQLDSSERVPIDANYQSLNIEGYQQLDNNHNENVQQYASLNIDTNPSNESIYEVIP